MTTKEDIKKVTDLVYGLRKLGVPESICNNIDVWNKDREKLGESFVPSKPSGLPRDWRSRILR